MIYYVRNPDKLTRIESETHSAWGESDSPVSARATYRGAWSSLG